MRFSAARIDRPRTVPWPTATIIPAALRPPGNNAEKISGAIMDEEFSSRLLVCPACRLAVMKGTGIGTYLANSFIFPTCSCGSENARDDIDAPRGKKTPRYRNKDYYYNLGGMHKLAAENRVLGQGLFHDVTNRHMQ